MTAITKAEKKLEELKSKIPEMTPKLAEKVKFGIEILTEIIDLFNYRKRKTEKKDLDSLYTWFEDEFDVAYAKVTE